MWIQVVNKSGLQIKSSGTLHNVPYGAWIDTNEIGLNNQKIIERLIAQNQIKPLPDYDFELDIDSVGIVSPHNLSFPYRVNFTQHDSIEPVYEKTCFAMRDKSINKQVKAIRNPARLKLMLSLLETWDLILVLGAFKENAKDVGHNEHERTIQIVGNLQVKFYSPDVFAMRDTESTRKFCKILASEIEHGERLALVRALFLANDLDIKPYYLGTDWI